MIEIKNENHSNISLLIRLEKYDILFPRNSLTFSAHKVILKIIQGFRNKKG